MCQLLSINPQATMLGTASLIFEAREDARYALAACNGRPIREYYLLPLPLPACGYHRPSAGTGKMFRLNWSTGGRARQLDPEFSVFVGDLSDEVDDILLYQTFATRYYTIKSAKVCDAPLLLTVVVCYILPISRLGSALLCHR